MRENYQIVNVEEIDFDRDNPRIKMALEKYGDQLNAERIYFALQTAMDGEQKTSSFSALKDSIRANKGITQPITVILIGDKKICIDGNSRLAIYKDFLKQEISGDWSRIKSLVIEDADQRDIETIRVSAHLVGVREWPAYEKARYLDYLRNQEVMKTLGVYSSGGGCDQIKLRNQMKRLFGCTVSMIYEDEHGEQFVSSLIAERGEFWWNERKPDQSSLWDSKIYLGEAFFNEIIHHPVPIDMNTPSRPSNAPCWASICTSG